MYEAVQKKCVYLCEFVRLDLTPKGRIVQLLLILDQ